jgi:hypothetical protein
MVDAVNGYKSTYKIPFRSPDKKPTGKTITARTFPSLKVTQQGGKRASFKRSVGKEFKQIALITQRYVRSDLKAPPKSRKPIRWSSVIQGRAFYATNGFGGGIPSRRASKIDQQWEVGVEQTARNKQRQSYIFSVENPNPDVRYIYGGFTSATNWQQFYHWDRGWTNILGYDERLYNKIILPQLVFVFENRFKDVEALLRSEIGGILAKAGASMRNNVSSQDALTDPYAVNTRRVLNETGGLSGLFEVLETFLE